MKKRDEILGVGIGIAILAGMNYNMLDYYYHQAIKIIRKNQIPNCTNPNIIFNLKTMISDTNPKNYQENKYLNNLFNINNISEIDNSYQKRSCQATINLTIDDSEINKLTYQAPPPNYHPSRGLDLWNYHFYVPPSIDVTYNIRQVSDEKGHKSINIELSTHDSDVNTIAAKYNKLFQNYIKYQNN